MTLPVTPPVIDDYEGWMAEIDQDPAHAIALAYDTLGIEAYDSKLGQIREHSYKFATNMVGGMARFIIFGIRPGSFASAVLRNDLSDAAGAADYMNQRLLYEWASFVYNCVPSSSRRDSFEPWIRSGGLFGQFIARRDAALDKENEDAHD